MMGEGRGGRGKAKMERENLKQPPSPALSSKQGQSQNPEIMI